MVNIVKRSPRLGDIARLDPFTSMEDWADSKTNCNS